MPTRRAEPAALGGGLTTRRAAPQRSTAYSAGTKAFSYPICCAACAAASRCARAAGMSPAKPCGQLDRQRHPVQPPGTPTPPPRWPPRPRPGRRRWPGPGPRTAPPRRKTRAPPAGKKPSAPDERPGPTGWPLPEVISANIRAGAEARLAASLCDQLDQVGGVGRAQARRGIPAGAGRVTGDPGDVPAVVPGRDVVEGEPVARGGRDVVERRVEEPQPVAGCLVGERRDGGPLR